MPLTFPNAPTEGQQHAAGGLTYIYTGGVWVVQTIGPEEVNQMLATLENAINNRIATEAQAKAGGDQTALMTPYLVARARSQWASLVDEKPSGTNGGTATSGAWRTRDLNLFDTNEFGASVAANQVTFPAGRYRIWASAPCYAVTQHRVRLYDVGNAVVLRAGLSEIASAGDNVQTRSSLHAVLAFAVPTTFELQHFLNTSRSSNGFGPASGDGLPERYASLIAERLYDA